MTTTTVKGGGGGDNWAVKLLSRVTKCTNHITHFTTKEVNISFRQFMLNRFKYTSRYTTSTKYYIASLLFVILAKMMLGFGLAVMALVLCVAVAGFHYFGHVINLYRGLKGQPTDNPRPQRKRRRGKRRGRGRQIRGTDQSTEAKTSPPIYRFDSARGRRRMTSLSDTEGRQLQIFSRESFFFLDTFL